MEEVPRSTQLVSRHLTQRPDPKRAQESTVGNLFVRGYEDATGLRLENARQPKQDPPDLLLNQGERTIGVEFFELPAYYAERHFLEAFANLAYAEFARRGLEERLSGIAVDPALLVSSGLREAVKQRQSEAGVTARGLKQAAADLVDIVARNVASRDALPETIPGLLLKVIASEYPALATLTATIYCTRCSENEVGRSDGRASPLVQAGGIYFVEPIEMIQAAAAQLDKKIARRKVWEHTEHAILVAHDIPRTQLYQAFNDWERWLPIAAESRQVANHFDEVWLVRAMAQDKAVRIAGEGL